MNSLNFIADCPQSTHPAIPSLTKPKQKKLEYTAGVASWLAHCRPLRCHSFGNGAVTSVSLSSVRLEATTTHHSVTASVDNGRRGESVGVNGSFVKADDLEENIEKVIYICRFMAFLGVAGSLMGSVICFLKGCEYVIDTFREHLFDGGKAVLLLIEAIDIYLIGTVMLVFGMGLYELFISNLDIAKLSSRGSSLLGLFKLPERPRWLEIQSVNELKTKLGHVIVTVLLVGMVEKSKKVIISSPTDMFCFAASILLCSVCLYLLSKLHSGKEVKHG